MSFLFLHKILPHEQDFELDIHAIITIYHRIHHKRRKVTRIQALGM
jgi:hypothetical protein